MQHQAGLLLRALDFDEPHRGPGDRLADWLSVDFIALATLDIGFDVPLKDKTLVIVGNVTADNALVQSPSEGRPQIITRVQLEDG